MMVVAELNAGNGDAVEDAIIGAWQLQSAGGATVPAQEGSFSGSDDALLMCACLPVSEFGEAWPEGVPVQVHGKWIEQ